MAAETATFAFGSAILPVTDDTTNSLLRDADPALFYALALLSTTFDFYFGKRLKAQAMLHGLKLPGAVVATAAMEPTPFLLNDQQRFPLFCLYRKKDVWDEHTVVFDKSTSTWEFAYVLPPLTPVQARDLHPILRSVSVTMRRVIHMGTDPSYNNGEVVWDTARIQHARLIECTYGQFELIDTNAKYYRALTGTIGVLEREMSVDGAFEALDGVDAATDIHDVPTNTTIVDVADIATHKAPTVTVAVPNSGTHLGGTAVTLTGTDFRPIGPLTAVTLGGKACTSIVRVNATTITCVTPAKAALASALADFVVTNDDGQSDTLSAGFTFT